MKTIHKAYKTKLDPTREQVATFKQCGRVARTAFNWVLADYNREYAEWIKATEEATEKAASLGIFLPEKPDRKDREKYEGLAAAAGIVFPKKPKANGRVERKKKLNATKKTDPKLSFLQEMPYVILQEAVEDFDSAMKKYMEKKMSGEVARTRNERFGGSRQEKWKRRYAKMKERGRAGEQLDPYYPTFKTRFDDCRFRFQGPVKIEESAITFPKIGKVRLAEKGYIPPDAKKVCSASVSQSGENWYVAVAVEVEIEEQELQPITLGVSVGVMDLAATSTGHVYGNPRFWKDVDEKKKRLQRELSRRTRYNEEGKMIRGENWKKTKRRIEKLEAEIARKRAYSQHEISKQITDTLPEKMVLKQMGIKDMMKGSKVARYIGNAAMGELSRKIQYKAGWNGTQVVRVEKVTVVGECSGCGSQDTTTNRPKGTLICNNCGVEKRASINTAENLARQGVEN